jgi:Flp pilus assembly protein TadG
MRSFGYWGALLRRLRRNKDGVAAIEFALILPLLMTMSFGIMEVSLCMASLVTLEGGLKQASRYGITDQAQSDLSNGQLAQVPEPFKVGNDPRKEMIGLILSQNTLNLIDLDDADVDIKTYDSFSAIKNGEPYTDLDGNGAYSPDYDNGKDSHGNPLPKGEPFSDLNCNEHWDGPGATGTGPGVAGQIVVYTINYDWKILTPFVGPLLGTLKNGKYVLPLSASIVVKNEPSLSGSTFCS